MLLGLGGTMLMVAPNSYPAVAKQVIRELGIEAERFGEFHHEDLFESLGTKTAAFFDQETFGADYLAVGSEGYSDAYCMVEYMPHRSMTDILKHNPFSLDNDGRITVPTGAGLGLELNDEFRK
jgi:spermidine dehydrogenase